MVKNASDFEGFEGGEACEYISTNIANLFMPNDTPKFRLHKSSDGKVQVASTYIDGFKTVYDTRGRVKPDPESRARLLGTAFLTGHYDIHGHNVGYRTDDKGKNHFALIDFGRGLSYAYDCNWDGKLNRLNILQTFEKFKERMIQGGDSYTNKNDFDNLDFIIGLHNFHASIDSKRVQSVVELCVENVKLAYGENYSKFTNELRKRTFAKSSDPNPEVAIICGCIRECSKEIKKMVDSELTKFKIEAIARDDVVALDKISKLSLKSNNTQADFNFEAIKASLLEQRSFLSKIQIRLGKKLDSDGLTKIESESFSKLKKALQNGSIRQDEISKEAVKKVLNIQKWNKAKIFRPRSI